MKRLCMIFSVLSVCLFLGCTVKAPRYIYSPSAPNNPFFQKKGDSKLAAFYSYGKNENDSSYTNHGYDLQAAYAFSNHFAVTADYYNRTETNNYLGSLGSSYSNYFYDSYVYYKRNMTEAGMGYFFSLNDRKTVVVNLLAGMGFGSFSINENGKNFSGLNYSRNYSNHFTKIYFQPSINFFATKYLRFGFVFKTSNLHYETAATNYLSNEKSFFYLDKIENKNFQISEFSGINFQLNIPRYNWVKLEGIITSSSRLPSDTLPKVRTYNASVGLTFDLDKVCKHH